MLLKNALNIGWDFSLALEQFWPVALPDITIILVLQVLNPVLTTELLLLIKVASKFGENLLLESTITVLILYICAEYTAACK